MMAQFTEDRTRSNQGKDMDMASRSGLMAGSMKATGVTIREKVEAS